MSAQPVLRSVVVGLASDHAWTMARGLAEAGAPIVAIIEPDIARRKEARAKIGSVSEYSSLDEVPSTEHFDIALVTTDNVSKPAAIEWASRRGIAVYADKPLAASGAAAKALEIVVAGAKKPIMVAFHTVFDGVHDEAKSLLQQGAIGRVHFVRGVAGHGGLKAANVSETFASWLVDPQRGGGGTFIDQAVYLLNTFMDQLDSQVTEVTGIASNFRGGDDIPDGVENISAALLRFDNGAIGVVDTKWLQVGSSPIRLAYHGTSGTLTDFGGHWILQTKCEPELPEGWTLESVGSGLRTYRRQTPASRGYVAESLHLIGTIQGSGQLHSALSVASAARVQHIVDAYYESVRSGAGVAVKLDDE